MLPDYLSTEQKLDNLDGKLDALAKHNARMDCATETAFKATFDNQENQSMQLLNLARIVHRVVLQNISLTLMNLVLVIAVVLDIVDVL